MNKKIEVILKHKSRYVDRGYTYLAKEYMKPGFRVIVPFGKGNKEYEALIIKETKIDEKEDLTGLKEAIKLIDEKEIISYQNLEIAKWIKEEYMCSSYEGISLFLPKYEKTNHKYRRILVSNIESKALEELKLSQRKTAHKKIELIEALIQGEIDIKEFQQEKGSYAPQIKSLLEENIVRIEEILEYRKPENNYSVSKKDINLNLEQKAALYQIKNTLDRPVLLYGVTGSGKTEVYIELLLETLKEKKGAIVLVPEISLTPQTIARFKNVFGNRIALLHSGLSEGQRKDQWQMVKEGICDIVIGARSAIFAPVENLGLIIIDECHDDAYRSEQNPKYDTVQVAEKMGEIYNCKVVLGSATPRIEQYYKGKNSVYKIVEMNNRASGTLPSVELFDIMELIKSGEEDIVSSSTTLEIQKEIDKGKQVIVFINNRGFASSLTCASCGDSVKCPHCDITLTYHKKGEKLLCHYCGFTSQRDITCTCGSTKFINIGGGTQKIEQELKSKINNSKIIRMDRDSSSDKGSHEDMLSKFKNQEGNILIGTQMISKGLDFENVNLVVILNADQGLRIPDYRSYEKTFSMLTQVSGRSGRSEDEGRVIIQTLEPGNKIFTQVADHDYKGFYENEILEREIFKYPPFGTIIRIVASSMWESQAADTVEKIKNAVEFYGRKRNTVFEVLGPTQCLIGKVDSKYRWQLFYKIQKEEDLKFLKNIINFILSEKRSIIVSKETSVGVEINPKNLM